MLRKFFPLLAISLWGVVVLPWSQPVHAATPLTRAEIRDLRNLVQLIPKNSPKRRPARKLDPMTPGDGLSTGRASLADLRFNDGSLARVGEQAIFQFLPKTRNFRLSNGTVLLLIPPGKGQTRIQTPNAAAAIRGSALFVRYDEATDTTIVGALTNSGIEVSNKHSQGRVLEAGQLMVIVKDKIQGLYDFDLRNFYETSDLVRGLDLTRQNLAPTPDPAIASVQAETSAAVATQTPIAKGDGVLENPSFLQLTATSSSESNSSASSNEENSSTSNQEETSVNPSQEDLNVDSLVDTGEVQVSGQLGNNSNNNTNNTSISIPQQPQPNNEQPKPNNEQPKPDNEQPKPNNEQPKPNNEQPKPDNEQPKPNNEQPKPDNEQPKPDNEQPKPNNEQPKPDNEQPKPDNEQPKPDNEQPKPDNEQPKPDNEQPKPNNEQPKPDNEQPKPDNEQPKPNNEQPKPDNEQPKPDNEQPKPDNEQPKPDNGQPNAPEDDRPTT
ncbi:hypothetical protein NIES22_31440 [Calothrix brevissima NIES-22]|nr:hypothetical protein NIES22_31440 [Calothrix brevissima NIES-22]